MRIVGQGKCWKNAIVFLGRCLDIRWECFIKGLILIHSCGRPWRDVTLREETVSKGTPWTASTVVSAVRESMLMLSGSKTTKEMEETSWNTSVSYQSTTPSRGTLSNISNLTLQMTLQCFVSYNSINWIWSALKPTSGEEVPPSTIQLVQIYFNTATFDDIERDKKIKTEAQLSLIGGTMGLLTGFSIISGVEIIFFLLRSSYQHPTI